MNTYKSNSVFIWHKSNSVFIWNKHRCRIANLGGKYVAAAGASSPLGTMDDSADLIVFLFFGGSLQEQ